MDFKLIYNPKKYNKMINKAKVVDVYGRRENGLESGRLIEKPAVYSIAPNELKKFRTDVADYLLGKYDFLRDIEPEQVDEILKEMKDKPYKCKLCDFETETPLALSGHMRSHKLSQEAKTVLDGIPEAMPEAYVIGAEYSKSRQTEFVSVDSSEGIPATSNGRGAVDGSGVEWYGEGLESERVKGGQRPVVKRSTPGQRPTTGVSF